MQLLLLLRALNHLVQAAQGALLAALLRQGRGGRAERGAVSLRVLLFSWHAARGSLLGGSCSGRCDAPGCWRGGHAQQPHSPVM
jgi:hypothetical protein